MKSSRLFHAYLIPICVYQSVAIAGGYGSGREVMEFFTRGGTRNGVYGLLVSALVLAAITAVTFEFARKARVYDYRSFFRALIGPFWIGFEAFYLILFLIVIAVIASAAGTVLSDQAGISESTGLLLMLCIIGTLAFLGREIIEKLMVFLTLLLFLAFAFYFGSVLNNSTSSILQGFLTPVGSPQSGWLGPALKFAFYSAPVAPLVLSATRGISSRKDALLSGGLCGLIFMVPGFLLHISFFSAMPAVVEQKLPVYWLIEQLGIPLLAPVYLLAMFGTFVGTAIGFIQALNERLDYWVKERGGNTLPPWVHSGVGIGGFLIAAGLGQFGIITLIAKGYGTVAWGFLVFFIFPILTIGVYRIFFTKERIVGTAQ